MPYIQYPDVTAPGTLGQIDMHPGDVAAAKSTALAVNVAFRRIVDNGTGQQVTRNRKDGAIIKKIGTGTAFSVANSAAFGNKPILRVSGNGLVFEIDPAVTKPSASYCIVIPIAFTQEEIDGSIAGARQILSRASLTPTLKMSIRITNGSLIFTPDQVGATSPWIKPLSELTANTPYIFAFEWNDLTKYIRVFINDIDTPVFNAYWGGLSSAIVSGDRYYIFAGGTSNVGAVRGDYADLDIYNKSMTDDIMGKIEVSALFTALKSYYGIA